MSLFKTKVHPSIKEKRCELHSCLRHAMRLARFAGVFPVEGLGYTTPAKIRYKLKSVYGVYFSIYVIAHVTLVLLTLQWHEKNNDGLVYISTLYFFVHSLISTILFQTLAKHWPKLMQTAMEIEESVNDLRISKYTALKTKIVTYGVIILALVEHLLLLNHKILIVIYCLKDGTASEVMEYHLKIRFSYVFNILPYNIVTGALMMWFALQATFLWSFTDLLIMCFSIYITAYFNNINKAITIARRKASTNWGELRAHYSRLVALVQEINRHIRGFILLSLFTDLLYICIQMFNSLHRNKHEFENCSTSGLSLASSSVTYLMYFVYSFLFLALRTLMMCIYAANVHSAAQKPIITLYDIPASAYDKEVIRFQYQVRYTPVGLCGYFFYVTRNMILKVISTIITYELVLLQFNRPGNLDGALMDLQSRDNNVTSTVPPTDIIPTHTSK